MPTIKAKNMDLMFGSDNGVGISPEILTAIARSNYGYAVAYGDDQWTVSVNEAYSAFFERECYVFSVPTGTAANALALATITPPYGQIVCHKNSHIFTTEGGAPEFYCGGSRLLPLDCAGGKISYSALEDCCADEFPPNRHHMRLAALSLTQPTELGTLYSVEELASLSGLARSKGIKVHMDGAKLANALAALACRPADLTWRSGIDVLSLGTTKNGTMNAEAVIVFDEPLARELAARHKRAGLLTSKMRYPSVQLITYLANDLWKKNAQAANSAARELAAALEKVPGAALIYPVETNQIFVEFSEAALEALDAAKIKIRRWGRPRPNTHRLVTSFSTETVDIAHFSGAFQTQKIS